MKKSCHMTVCGGTAAGITTRNCCQVQQQEYPQQIAGLWPENIFFILPWMHQTESSSPVKNHAALERKKKKCRRGTQNAHQKQ